MVAYPYGLTPRAWHDVLAGLLGRVGIAPRYAMLGPHKVPPWGVYLRTAEQEGATLVNLVNFTREPQTVHLKGPEPVDQAAELFSNRTVTLPLELPSLEPVLLRIEY